MRQFSIFFTIIFLCLGIQSNGQTGFCAQQQIHEQLWQQKPEVEIRHRELDKLIREHIQNGNHSPVSAIYTLPVVVHIIHNGGAENIPDAQVLQGIQDLNDAFTNVGYYDPTTGLDTDIEFCLARRDPDGNATTGITRDMSPLTEMILETEDITVKDINRWDPTQYINIWLVRAVTSSAAGAGVVGYAYFPASHGDPEDGIMMEADWFGSNQGQSSVIVHEMGHYLGVYHTFQGGCPNNDCLVDGDMVCDTPPDGSTAAVPCNGSTNSCMTDTDSGFATDQDDMFWNYMDYGDWNCYSAFTAGQVERMHFSIENPRVSLLSSLACLDPCNSPLTAAFAASSNTIEVGGNVIFTNASSNASTAAWEIDGVGFSNNFNSNFTFNQVGFFEICVTVANADPNCFDKICQTIEVTCPVEVAFTTDNFYPLPGQTVNYTNTSLNASDYEWQIDGTPQASTADFSTSFPVVGVYDVCLVASNGLCEAEFCVPVFVSESNAACEGSYLKYFGEAGVEEISRAIVATPDGNLLIGGRRGNASLLLLVNPAGDLLWERTFDMTNGADFIDGLLIDSEGMLLVVGRDQPNAATLNYIFRYDFQNDVLLWKKLMPQPTYTRIVTLLELPASGNYILGGMVENPSTSLDNLLMEVDRATGDQVWIRTYHSAGNTDVTQSIQFYNSNLYSSNVNRYGGGLDKIRPTISKFDLSGDQQWTKAYYMPPSGSARQYMKDLHIANDTIVGASYGDRNGSTTTDYTLQLIKTDLDGVAYWAKDYQFTGSSNNAVVRELLVLPDGYIVTGTHNFNGGVDVYFLRTDKEGNPLWAKSVGGVEAEDVHRAILHNSLIYFAGSTTNFDPSSDIFFGSISIDGEVAGPGCEFVNDLEVIVTEIADPYDDQNDLTEVGVNYTLQDDVGNSSDVELPDAFFPDCECFDNVACDTSFLKTFGTPGGAEFGRSIVAAPNGGFFLGGGIGNEALLSLLDAENNLVWARQFDPTFDADDFIWKIKLDSDDDLIGIGQTAPVGNNVEVYAFKYDWQNDLMIWLNELDIADPAGEGYYDILEKAPGDNFYIIGQTTPVGNTESDALLLEVNRNTGTNVFAKTFSLGWQDRFVDATIANNSIYIAGDLVSGPTNASADKRRAGLSRIELDGDHLWTKLYLRDVAPGTGGDLFPVDIVEDNGIVVYGAGDSLNLNGQNQRIFLFRTDFDGSLEWAKSYDIPGALPVKTASRMLNLPDGYLCMGNFFEGTNADVFIFKTDQQGDLVWSKRFGGAGNELGHDVIWKNGLIYLTGRTDDAGSNDILLASLNPDGSATASDTCNLLKDLIVTATDWQNAYDGQHDLSETNLFANFFTNTETTETVLLQQEVICANPCEELDSCDFVPDAVFQDAIGQCMGDSLLVTLTICNIGNFELPAGTPVSCYDGDPSTGTPNLVSTTLLSEKIKRDSCLTFTFQIPTAPLPIFILINDAGGGPLPIDLAGGMPDTDITECDYTNNIGSFDFNYTPPVLDLGPDIVVCENGVVVLDAGPGFFSYRWQDGDEDQTYTAFFPGTYSVEVTDSCGGVQTDEVTITVAPASIADLGPDTLVCEGDSLLLSINGFDRFEWFPKNIFPCDTCSVVSVLPQADSTVEVIVVVSSDLGCYSVDTLLIGTTQPVFTRDTLYFCPGDTVQIFGEAVTQAGEYVGVFPRAEGCDSTHTISLEAIANLFLQLPADLTIDLGDSVKLNPVTNGIDLTWQWTPTDWLSCDDCKNPFARPFETTLFTVFATDKNGCDASDDILLTVLKDRAIYIPNAFSPNGDGVNDIFHIYAGGNVEGILEFQIFDRWGELIFEDYDFPPNDPTHGWNGVFRTEPMDPAVFVYKAEVEYVDGVTEVFYGDVTLVR